MGIIVAKFGGWANAHADRVKAAADLFEQEPRRRVKVNSAIGKVEGLPKVTDLLKKGAEACLQEGRFPDDVLEQIRLNHYQVFKPLGLEQKQIDEVLSVLHEYISRKDDLSPDYYRALLLGSGEELFSRLDAVYLKQVRGLDAAYVDPRDIGHYLEGHPLDGKITGEGVDNLKKLAGHTGILVYPGFFGVEKTGKPMVYSRGGTDKTAADLAAALAAEIYENWKDVDGILSADPGVVENPSLMEEVTYHEIRELSYISFNVLHQEAMLPVMRAGIPINLRNLLKPDTPGTMIVSERKMRKDRPVVGIAHMENVAFLNIEKALMNEEIGFANLLLNILKEHRISIDQITTGIDSMCLVISETEFREKTTYPGISEQLRRAIDPQEFADWLQDHLSADSVQIRRNKALVCVVGEGMSHTVGLLARISNAISQQGINIEIIDQGPSERNIIFGVDCSEDAGTARRAVNIIYDEFFK